MDRQIVRQIYRQKDRQINRQIEKQIDRKKDRQIDRQKYRYIERQEDRQKNRLIERKKERTITYSAREAPVYFAPPPRFLLQKCLNMERTILTFSTLSPFSFIFFFFPPFFPSLFSFPLLKFWGGGFPLQIAPFCPPLEYTPVKQLKTQIDMYVYQCIIQLDTQIDMYVY